MYFGYRAITCYDVGFQQLFLYIYFVTLLVKRRCYPTTPYSEEYGLGCSRFARRYSGNIVTTSHFFLFLSVLRCFTSRGALRSFLWWSVIEVCSIGFPHSEISGSKVRDTSPKRIAASRVFHRHVEPRHPPYALDFLLGNLEIIFMFSPSFIACGPLRKIKDSVSPYLQQH